MKRLILAVLVAAIPGLLAVTARAAQAPASPAAAAQPPKPVAAHAAAASTLTAAEQTAMVKQYCTGCHSDRGKAGQLTLASFDASKAADDVVITEKMIRKLRAQMMPPPGSRRPDPGQITALTEALEARVDRAAALHPDPGSRPFQRLNRAEYARAVAGLFDLEVDVSAFLPPDTSATASTTSPTPSASRQR